MHFFFVSFFIAQHPIFSFTWLSLGVALFDSHFLLYCSVLSKLLLRFALFHKDWSDELAANRLLSIRIDRTRWTFFCPLYFFLVQFCRFDRNLSHLGSFFPSVYTNNGDYSSKMEYMDLNIWSLDYSVLETDLEIPSFTWIFHCKVQLWS